MKTNKISLVLQLLKKKCMHMANTWPEMIPLRKKKAIEIVSKIHLYNCMKMGAKPRLKI